MAPPSHPGTISSYACAWDRTGELRTEVHCSRCGPQFLSKPDTVKDMEKHVAIIIPGLGIERFQLLISRCLFTTASAGTVVSTLKQVWAKSWHVSIRFQTRAQRCLSLAVVLAAAPPLMPFLRGKTLFTKLLACAAGLESVNTANI
jgi:hypothetical protein